MPGLIEIHRESPVLQTDTYSPSPYNGVVGDNY